MRIVEPAAWWRKDRHADRRPFLLGRVKIAKAVRGWFEAEGFLEVETATLQIAPGGEAHLHGFETQLLQGDGEGATAYLRTSPEFACKKLLAAGEERIFEFGRVWRNRERGPLHHPEFTMLEWYRAHEPYDRLMTDCGELLALAAEMAGTSRFLRKGRACDPISTPERMTVQEAFLRFADVDVLATVSPGGEGDREALAYAAVNSGVRVAEDDLWADVFSKILVERVEPNLGIERPTILYEYPSPEAALARLSPNDRRVAERFELYACGVELANAFGELTDPKEQRRRFEADRALKLARYGAAPPLYEGLLEALAAMPPASGCALGFDRLVMLATGAERIEQVIWSPAPEVG
ncbi:EF-P lysine aminoacylase EpmA [soil metagenome]